MIRCNVFLDRISSMFASSLARMVDSYMRSFGLGSVLSRTRVERPNLTTSMCPGCFFLSLSQP